MDETTPQLTPPPSPDSDAAVLQGEDPARPPELSVAREYRRRRDRQQAPYRMVVAALVVLGLLNFAAYYGIHGSILGPSGNGSLTVSGPSGPTDNVTLGTPTIHNTTCGDGRTVQTEWVPWVGAQVAPTTAQVILEVAELLDGDVDGGPTPAPTVTATSLCPGAPPSVSPSWYVVLRDPAGANVATFSYATSWVILSHLAAAEIFNGSALVMVADPPLAGTSFALCVLGTVGAPSISACAQL